MKNRQHVEVFYRESILRVAFDFRKSPTIMRKAIRRDVQFYESQEVERIDGTPRVSTKICTGITIGGEKRCRSQEGRHHYNILRRASIATSHPLVRSVCGDSHSTTFLVIRCDKTFNFFATSFNLLSIVLGRDKSKSWLSESVHRILRIQNMVILPLLLLEK